MTRGGALLLVAIGNDESFSREPLFSFPRGSRVFCAHPLKEDSLPIANPLAVPYPSSMSLPPLPFVVLDTETTGFVPRVHRVIEFASIRYEHGKQVEEYEQLFACAEIPPHVEVLTRIKTDHLKGRPPFADKKEEILQHLPEDALIVGQNVTFDIGMLKGEGIDLSNRPWIDTSMLASLVFPELESYSLGYLSEVLKLNHEPPHRALGDVRATLELLSKCWERLSELSSAEHAIAHSIMQKAPEGYRRLFAALPSSSKKKSPPWISWKPEPDTLNAPAPSAALHVPATGDVDLVEEPLDPAYLPTLVEASLQNPTINNWIAVKMLRSVVNRLPSSIKDRTKELRILYPARAVLDQTGADALLAQDAFTADEATLALKLSWYKPATREDLPLHGGEEPVWNAKVGCAPSSPAYLKQFKHLPSVVLLEHRDLLAFLDEPDHPGRKAMENNPHIIIDDASMLEDTATKAYGWLCPLDDLRAAAQGNTLLTRFMDTLQLWVEKTRQFQDIRYITDGDLNGPDAKGLRSLLDEVILQTGWSEQTLRQFTHLRNILDPTKLAHRIAWIEQRQNGSQFLHSVPDRIGQFLADHLFTQLPTTLLIPQGTHDILPEILAPGVKASLHAERYQSDACHVPLSYETDPPLDALLRDPPPGKTIILLPGRKLIEDMFVKHTETLEKRGITLICQGLNGGMGRMQAEFLAAPAPALWLLTPWMFEGIELPPHSVDHLILKTMPFDHPSHAVLSRRAKHYRDAFSHYSLPRLLHRLFRLLRTFCRFRTEDADVRILDERLHAKEYGKKVKAYVGQFARTVRDEVPQTTAVIQKSSKAKLKEGKIEKHAKAKKPSRQKEPEDQMKLF